MPVPRPRSTTARSALALGALTAALVLSPLAVSAAEAAPADHGIVADAAARPKSCYRTVVHRDPADPRHVSIRVIGYCGGRGHGHG